MSRRAPPLNSWTSALIAALVGFGGTVALIVQAMRTLGASIEQTSSSITALCVGIAVMGAALSLRHRIPIVLAWSTPGAAMLAASGGISWPIAVAAFIASGVTMLTVGSIPALGRLVERIPASIASAMLAGVLLPFCLGLFKTAQVDPLLVGLLMLVFVVARQRVPLYALLLVLSTGVGLTMIRGDVAPLPPGASLGLLIPTMPALDARTIISIGLPLFLVTLVSQNLPGLVVLRSAGYRPSPGSLLRGTGFISIVMAPFGAHSICLAAITAAICTGEEAHPDTAKRWTVAIIYAGLYVLLALASPLLVRFFVALPHSTEAALAGVALIPAIVGALATALDATKERDAAIVTFLATGSGMALFGLGAAFWGLVAGAAALAARRLGERGR